jgi:bacterioferritin-associated ferredoxin
MYICLCQGVTDRDIRRAVEQGATTFREVQEQLGVSTQCGSCELMARSVVAETMPLVPETQFYSPETPSFAVA